jgi:hypothetical protein
VTSEAERALRTKLTPNDLAILLPLSPGDPGFEATSLAPSRSGPKGRLIPTWVFNELTSSVSVASMFGDLRVTSVRIDPCANGVERARSGASCTAELRLVWQAATFEKHALSQLQDFNLHTIHALTDSELTAAVRKLQQLSASSGLDYAQAPLGPQPAIVAQGLSGAYGQGLTALVTELAGEKNLTRVALQSETVQDQTWIFTAFAVKNGRAVKGSLPTLRGKVQEVDENQQPPFDAVRPLSSSPDDVMFLQPRLAGSASGITAGDADRALRSALRVENPSVHDPSTIDCASCHLATVTRLALEARGFKETESHDKFTSGWNLSRTSPEEPADNDRLQMFAYRPGGTMVPVVRQRVINDAALSADRVNARFAR